MQVHVFVEMDEFTPISPEFCTGFISMCSWSGSHLLGSASYTLSAYTSLFIDYHSPNFHITLMFSSSNQLEKRVHRLYIYV